jgi:hypothetical protein
MINYIWHDTKYDWTSLSESQVEAIKRMDSIKRAGYSCFSDCDCDDGNCRGKDDQKALLESIAERNGLPLNVLDHVPIALVFGPPTQEQLDVLHALRGEISHVCHDVIDRLRNVVGDEAVSISATTNRWTISLSKRGEEWLQSGLNSGFTPASLPALDHLVIFIDRVIDALPTLESARERMAALQSKSEVPGVYYVATIS